MFWCAAGSEERFCAPIDLLYGFPALLSTARENSLERADYLLVLMLLQQTTMHLTTMPLVDRATLVFFPIHLAGSCCLSTFPDVNGCCL